MKKLYPFFLALTTLLTLAACGVMVFFPNRNAAALHLALTLSLLVIYVLFHRELTRDLSEHRRYEQLAYTDDLTGLRNRTAWRRDAAQWEGLSNVACIMMDVNDLKHCNDLYGHAEGDRLIQDTASCIKAAFGAIGQCYRMGGDEFAVVCVGLTAQELRSALDILEEEVRLRNRSRLLPLSIAVGCAVKEQPGDPFGEAFAASDQAMYREKSRMKVQRPL